MTNLHARAAKVAEVRIATPSDCGVDTLWQHISTCLALIAELDAALTQCRQKAIEDALLVVLTQEYYPDTHTGMRQQWVKDQIMEKLRTLAQTEAGDGG